jgi:predicted Zn-ribbon and HTH transcriptional regulator
VAFTHEELDRLIDDTRDRGVIVGPVYCGTCGYNLRTLPYVYRCPECGNEYNARPLSIRGIFLPSQCSIPVRDIAATVVCAVSAVAFGYVAVKGSNAKMLSLEGAVILYGIAVLLGLFAAHFGWASWRALFQYRRGRIITRRIAEEEGESAANHIDMTITANTTETLKPRIATKPVRPASVSQGRVGVGTTDLDRLADDMYKEYRIGGTVYCGNCGYNLRTLPYLYQCPECGNEYNARPLVMKGIFLPLSTSPPFVDMAAVVFCGPIAFFLIDGATQPFEPAGFTMGVLAAILTVVYFGICIRQWRTLIKTLVLLRRINRYEDDLAASDND